MLRALAAILGAVWASVALAATVNVTVNVNPPAGQHLTAVALSNATFTGGSASGTAIGTATATVAPASPAFSGSWSLTGTDAASFSINASTGALSTAAVLCTTGMPCTYSINIVATQVGLIGSPFTQPFTITATAVPQSIVGVSLSNNNFTAGSPTGTPVGTASAMLMPTSPAFSGSWSLTGTDAASFAIDASGNVTTVGTLCGSPPCTYSLNIVATQAGLTGSPFTDPVTITAPATGPTQTITDIQPHSCSFVASATIGTPICTSAAVLFPATPTFSGSYALSGTGSGNFTMNATTGVISTAMAGFCGSPPCAYNLTVTATGSYGGSPFGQALTITATAPMQSITGVALSNASFTAGSGSGTTVGTASAVLSPGSPAFSGTWSLTGTDAASFAISSAGVLSTVGVLCPSAPPACTYNINVIATQAGLTGSPFTQAETITAVPTIPPGTGDVDVVLEQSGLAVPGFWSVTKGGASAYSGAAISLRRDSDATTRTFNILNGTIDKGSIDTFCAIDAAHPANPNGNGGPNGCRWASIINQQQNGVCDLVSGNPATARFFSENPLQGGLPQYDTIRATNGSLIWALAAHNCTFVNGTEAQALVAEMFMPDGNTCCGQVGWNETTDGTTVMGSMFSFFIPLTGAFGQNAPWFGIDHEGFSSSVCCTTFQPGLMQEVGTMDGTGKVGYWHNGSNLVPLATPLHPVNHQTTLAWGRDGDAQFNGPAHVRSMMVIKGLPAGTTIGNLTTNMQNRAAAEASAPAVVQLSTANTITLTNQSGSPIAAWPFQFGRPFRPGDIPHNPQVLASNGAIPSQVDVKNRYPDGSVKFAIMATRVNLPAGVPITLTFQDNASLVAVTPMTATQMQAAADANMIFTPTPSIFGGGSSVSLDTMLGSSPSVFTYWTGGSGSLSLDGNPVITSIKVEDNSLARKFDIGFGDGFHPLRPAYYATYYAGGPVHIRFVGEASNDQELEDINYIVALSVNGSTVVTRTYNGSINLLSGYPLRHFAGSVWTEEYWAGTAPSAQVDMDFNALGYIADTRAFPQFNPEINVDVAYTNPQSSYVRNPNLAPFYPQEAGGWWLGGSGAVGGRPDIGSFPGPFVLPLYIGKWQQWQYARALADQFSAFPMQIKETKAGIPLNIGDNPALNTGLGYPISRNGWPNLQGLPIAPVGTIGPNIWNGPDPAHQPDPYYPLYETAFPDEFYLDEDQHLAAWSVRNVFPGGCVGGNFQHCAIWEANARGHWMDRNVCEASVIDPDSDQWHVGAQPWIFNDIAWQEGAFQAPGAHYPATALYANGHSTGPVGTVLSGPFLKGVPPPLGNQDAFVPSDQTDPNIVNNSTIAGDNSPWMEDYADYARSRCDALGFPEDAVIGATGKFLVGMINDSGNPMISGMYRFSVAVKDGMGNPEWPTSWAQTLTGLNTAYLTGSGYPTPNNPSVGPLGYYFGTYGLNADQGYPVSAQLGGASLMEIGISGSPAMWGWLNTNVATARAEANAGGSSDPRYDLVPYQGRVTLPRLTGNPP